MKHWFLVMLVACKANRGEHRESWHPEQQHKDPMEHALELRDQAREGVPTWPAATKWLATDRTIEVAIDHGNELVASDGNHVLRIPKDGSAVQVIVEVPLDTKIVDLTSTSKSILYATFQRAEIGVHGGGVLWSVPFAGGKPIKLRDADIGDEYATYGTQLWLAHDKQVLASKEPALAKLVPITDKGHYTEGLAADARGVWWLEAEYDKTKHGDWICRPDKRVEVPLMFIIHTLYADDHRLLVIAGDAKPATAPGGGEYFESKNAIYAIDEAGQVQLISEPIGEIWHYAVSGSTLCTVDDGPKMGFGKSTSVLAITADGSRRTTTLASGLDHATAHAIDATACYVTVHGKSGIAAVPL